MPIIRADAPAPSGRRAGRVDRTPLPSRSIASSIGGELCRGGSAQIFSTAGAIRSARQFLPMNSGMVRVSDTRLTSVTVSTSSACASATASLGACHKQSPSDRRWRRVQATPFQRPRWQHRPQQRRHVSVASSMIMRGDRPVSGQFAQQGRQSGTTGRATRARGCAIMMRQRLPDHRGKPVDLGAARSGQGEDQREAAEKCGLLGGRRQRFGHHWMADKIASDPGRGHQRRLERQQGQHMVDHLAPS